jgi:hypothetical protein
VPAVEGLSGIARHLAILNEARASRGLEPLQLEESYPPGSFAAELKALAPLGLELLERVEAIRGCRGSSVSVEGSRRAAAARAQVGAQAPELLDEFERELARVGEGDPSMPIVELEQWERINEDWDAREVLARAAYSSGAMSDEDYDATHRTQEAELQHVWNGGRLSEARMRAAERLRVLARGLGRPTVRVLLPRRATRACAPRRRKVRSVSSAHGPPGRRGDDADDDLAPALDEGAS